MNSLEETGLAEKAQAEELIAATPRMPEVEGVSVRLDEDWSGDPSLYLTFRIKADATFDEGFFLRFNEYAGEVQKRILHSGISRFPYTRLQEAA